MSILTYLANLLRPEPISPERKQWHRQPWHGTPNYDLRIRLCDAGSSITYWRGGQTWKFWVARGQRGQLYLQLLRNQANPELDWGPDDTARVLVGLWSRDEAECCGR